MSSNLSLVMKQLNISVFLLKDKNFKGLAHDNQRIVERTVANNSISQHRQHNSLNYKPVAYDGCTMNFLIIF